MQLKVYQQLETDLVLPIGYHHILQSILYGAVKENKIMENFLHDEGFLYHNRRFRMFTFGGIQGKYEIRKDKIVFRDGIMFEVRSPESMMIKTLYEYFSKYGVQYGEVLVKPENINLQLDDIRIEENFIKIQMISPICIYSTDTESKKTTYYHPRQMEFMTRLNNNFHRKYCAYTGMSPKSDIMAVMASVQEKDKYVTRYKGHYITGYMGEYALSGEAKYLDFLYQTGLGSKNSQGFGMFKLIDR